MALIEFTISQEKGYVYETEFLFKKTNLPSYNITTWDLGDGTTIYNPTGDEVKHTYKYPGLYKVSLSAWNQAESFETLSKYIDVDYKIRDAILIEQLPSKWSIVGQKTTEPFTVSLTSAKIDQPLAIVLHAIGSDSVPYTAVGDKWNFLIPSWYFIDAKTNKIVNGSVALSSTPIYGANNKVIAVSASASFYYVDHNSTINKNRTNPIVITATLSTQHFTYPPEALIYPYQSYSNTDLVKAATLWHVYDVIPNELNITENFLQPIYPIKWSQTKIPFMVTCRFNPARLSAYNFGYQVSAGDIFAYPKTNEIGRMNPLVVSLSGIPYRSYTVEDHTYNSLTNRVSSHLYFKAFDDNGAISSGYVFTGATVLSGISYININPTPTPSHSPTPTPTPSNTGPTPTPYPTTTPRATGPTSTPGPTRTPAATPTPTTTNVLPNAGETKITASTVFPVIQEATNDFKFPVGVPMSYVAYISHPFENNINEIEVNTFTQNFKEAQELKNQGLLLQGKISTISVPPVTNSNTNNLTLSGASGVQALAYNPTKKLLYAADSDSNRIFLYDEHKTLINTLQLSSARKEFFGSIPSLSANLDQIPISPSSLAIDEDHNIWIALYDSHLALKYDMNLTTRLASAAPMSNLLALYNSLDIKEEPYFTPSVVEVDRNSDIWVAYSHPVSGFLVKYTSEGVKTNIHLKYAPPAPPILQPLALASFSLPGPTPTPTATPVTVALDTLKPTPVDLAISKDNNVWVACWEDNKILHYNGSTGALIQNHCFDILRPSYITVDKQDNLWILHGYNLITKYDTATTQASSWEVTNFGSLRFDLIRNYKASIDQYTLKEINAIYKNNEIWGGISVDVLNRVWAVDSQTNTAFVIPATAPERLKHVSLIPAAHTNYYIRSVEDEYVQPVSATYVRSAQAVGDWTGNEWYQKFGNTYPTIPATATSNAFSVYDLYKDAPAVAKINENFDCAAYYKSLAFPELLREYNTLFDSFLPTLVGSGSIATQDIGRILYEKIANFNINHCDIDTAEISQFVSLFSQLKLEAETFGVDFPVEIERLINIFSVPLHRLRGRPVYDDFIARNVGELLTETSYITAGTYLYMQDKQYNTFQLIQVSTEDDTDRIVYPLSAIQINGIKRQEGGEYFKYYYFFEYDPQKTLLGYRLNIIDWQNPYTTISYNTSSWEFYYKDDGFVDLYFNNLLTKRLFDK